MKTTSPMADGLKTTAPRAAALALAASAAAIGLHATPAKAENSQTSPAPITQLIVDGAFAHDMGYIEGIYRRFDVAKAEMSNQDIRTRDAIYQNVSEMRTRGTSEIAEQIHSGVEAGVKDYDNINYTLGDARALGDSILKSHETIDRAAHGVTNHLKSAGYRSARADQIGATLVARALEHPTGASAAATIRDMSIPMKDKSHLTSITTRIAGRFDDYRSSSDLISSHAAMGSMSADQAGYAFMAGGEDIATIASTDGMAMPLPDRVVSVQDWTRQREQQASEQDAALKRAERTAPGSTPKAGECR